MHGVSTRSVDDLVKALGADSGNSKSEVSRICGDLAEQLTVFRSRPLDHSRFPCLYLDATYCRTDVVRVFPDPAALDRLVTAVLSEMHDEWIAFPCRYLPEGSMTAIYATEHAHHTTQALPNTPNATGD